MHGEPDCLANGCGGTVRESHEPRLNAGRGKGGSCSRDAGTEGKAFKGLVERDCQEKDVKGRGKRDGEGDSDEDGVEEDTGFKEEALQEQLLLGLMRREGVRIGGVALMERLRSRREWVEVVELIELSDRVLI